MIKQRIYLLVFILLFISNYSLAQNAPIVTEQFETFGKTSGNSLAIIIPEANIKDVEKEWKSLLKVYGGKAKESKGVISADGINISSMGPDTFMVYSKIAPVSEGVKLIAAFESHGKFVSNYESEKKYAAAENLLYNFSVRMAKQGVEEIKATAAKNYKALVRKKDQLQRKQDQLKKSIERWNENIRKAEKEMQNNVKDLEEMNKKIEAEEEQIKQIEEKEKQINKFN